MADRTINCPICWSNGAERVPRPPRVAPNDGVEFVRCPRCGVFGHTEEFRFDAERCIPTVRERGLLAGVVRHGFDVARDGAFPAVIDADNWAELVRAHAPPTDVEGRIDALLVAAAHVAPEYGSESPPEPLECWAARAYMWDVSLARQLIHDLQTLFVVKGCTLDQNRPALSLRLTLEGWRELRRRTTTTRASTKLFLATWADPEVARILEPATQRAAEATGLRVVIGNRLAGVGKIDDEIVAEIRSSRVVVADFTGARGGVYFEAGLALGCGVPVIFTCSENRVTRVADPALANAAAGADPGTREVRWFDLLHFDTRQYPHLLWKGGDDFERLLEARIRSWGLQFAPADVPRGERG